MQNTKSASITATQSAVLVRNVFRAAFSSIAYIRNFFGEENFELSKIGETKCYKIRPTGKDKDERVQTFVDWLEMGVFHALEQKYLDVVLLEVFGCENVNKGDTKGKGRRNSGKESSMKKQKLLECFCFQVSYNAEGADVHLSGQEGDTSRPNKAKIKKNVADVLRSLIELTNKLSPLPTNHVVGVKLLYTPETPPDYEPPQFSKADEDDMIWFEKEPVRTNVGDLETPYHKLNLVVRTVASDSLKGARESDRGNEMGKEMTDGDDMEIDVGGSQGNSGRVQKGRGAVLRETQEAIVDVEGSCRVDRSELHDDFKRHLTKRGRAAQCIASAKTSATKLRKKRKISKGNEAASKTTV